MWFYWKTYFICIISETTITSNKSLPDTLLAKFLPKIIPKIWLYYLDVRSFKMIQRLNKINNNIFNRQNVRLNIRVYSNFFGSFYMKISTPLAVHLNEYNDRTDASTRHNWTKPT